MNISGKLVLEHLTLESNHAKIRINKNITSERTVRSHTISHTHTLKREDEGSGEREGVV